MVFCLSVDSMVQQNVSCMSVAVNVAAVTDRTDWNGMEIPTRRMVGMQL